MLHKVNLTTKMLLVVALAVLSTTGAMWFAASKQIWSKLEAQQLEKADQYLRSLALVFSERFPDAKAKIVDGRVARVQSPSLAAFSDFSIVDASVAYVGGNATIFTYDQGQDKFIRRVTTVKKETGERAVGTELAATSPAQALVRRGEAYRGPVTLFGKRFETVYQPTFDVAGKVNGILYVGVPVEDFFDAYNDTMWTMSVAASLIALLSCIVVAWASSHLFRPMRTLSARIEGLTQGDLEAPIKFQERGDEIGALARSLTVFRETLIAKRMSDDAGVKEMQTKASRAHMLDETAKSFEHHVGSLTHALSMAATEMEATARSMSTTADQTTRQTVIVAGAAQETSANVQTVAAATEEMTASVQEIVHQVTQSSLIARQAVESAQRTDLTVQRLAVTAEQISTVLSVISGIASQTNLLALNATIEAARAGEAGRGFAVVATEVKELAGQTSRATSEIGERISEIQTATREAVSDIQAIGKIIAEMSNYTASVAAALEEQGTATQEITRNVQEAAKGTEQVTANISSVHEGAGQTGAAASQVLSAARELSQHSRNLTNEVVAFLKQVKAA